MALILQTDLKKGDVLLSLGELGRMLNLPESRIEKAVATGVIQPIGVIGRNTVVAMSARELSALDDAMKRLRQSILFNRGEVQLPPVIPEVPPPNRSVIPGTFNV